MASNSQEHSLEKSDNGSVQEIETLDPPKVISGDVGMDVYRLYKRRFAGLVGFVSWLVVIHVKTLMQAIMWQVILAAVSAMSWPWFGPISNNSTPYQ